jgi:hypothetical protein
MERMERKEEGREKQLPPHRVRMGHGLRRRVRTSLEARETCYKRRGAKTGAGDVLRRRSDENAKPVFLMPPASQAVSSSSGVHPQACPAGVVAKLSATRNVDRSRAVRQEGPEKEKSVCGPTGLKRGAGGR